MKLVAAAAQEQEAELFLQMPTESNIAAFTIATMNRPLKLLPVSLPSTLEAQ